MLKRMTSSKVPREQQLKFAIVCARGLGDALLSMILAHNLKLSGKQVTTFSSILCELKDWFPKFHIAPCPISEQFFSTLSSFDTVVAADHSVIKENHHFGNRLIILKENAFDKKLTMVENLRASCERTLALPFSLANNGITPLKGLTWRRYPRRLLLHPMSNSIKKNWPSEKFIALASLLEKEGYDPYFCVSPAEREFWEGIIAKERLPYFRTVSDLASFVFESGYLIGNDSGVGHLASALHIPTLSLFARKGYSHLWRPGWGPGAVCAPNLLLGSRLKQKYWKKLLSVRYVKKTFSQLREATLAHPSLGGPKF
jgi:heptosyltransferase III